MQRTPATANGCASRHLDRSPYAHQLVQRRLRRPVGIPPAQSRLSPIEPTRADKHRHPRHRRSLRQKPQRMLDHQHRPHQHSAQTAPPSDENIQTPASSSPARAPPISKRPRRHESPDRTAPSSPPHGRRHRRLIRHVQPIIPPRAPCHHLAWPRRKRLPPTPPPIPPVSPHHQCPFHRQPPSRPRLAPSPPKPSAQPFHLDAKTLPAGGPPPTPPPRRKTTPRFSAVLGGSMPCVGRPAVA